MTPPSLYPNGLTVGDATIEPHALNTELMTITQGGETIALSRDQAGVIGIMLLHFANQGNLPEGFTTPLNIG